MRRVTFLGSLLIVGLLSLLGAASQQSPARQQQARSIDVEKVRDNLFVLRSVAPMESANGGGNTAVLIAPSGVVVVDTKNPGWGGLILSKIQELTSKPVTTIINTHGHWDHVSGNVDFPATVDIVAHVNARGNMTNMAPISGLATPCGDPEGYACKVLEPVVDRPSDGPWPQPNVFKGRNGKGLPTKTFKDKLSLGSGPDRVDLYYFGRGHTNGDTFVVFPALRAMHGGDIVGGKGIPLLDANSGGSGVAIPDTLRKAADTIANVDTIIPGHGPLRAWSHVREYADFNRDFLTAVQEAKKAGKSVDEVVTSWKVPRRYADAGYSEPQSAALKRNVQIIYDELK